MALLVINVAATYFSTPVRRSIIGPPSLNCRVRDGNGCDPWGKATTKGEKGIEKGGRGAYALVGNAIH